MVVPCESKHHTTAVSMRDSSCIDKSRKEFAHIADLCPYFVSPSMVLLVMQDRSSLSSSHLLPSFRTSHEPAAVS